MSVRQTSCDVTSSPFQIPITHCTASKPRAWLLKKLDPSLSTQVKTGNNHLLIEQKTGDTLSWPLQGIKHSLAFHHTTNLLRPGQAAGSNFLSACYAPLQSDPQAGCPGSQRTWNCPFHMPSSPLRLEAVWGCTHTCSHGDPLLRSRASQRPAKQPACGRVSTEQKPSPSGAFSWPGPARCRLLPRPTSNKQMHTQPCAVAVPRASTHHPPRRPAHHRAPAHGVLDMGTPFLSSEPCKRDSREQRQTFVIGERRACFPLSSRHSQILKRQERKPTT